MSDEQQKNEEMFERSRREEKNSYGFILAQFISRVISSPDSLDRIDLILMAAQLTDLTSEEDAWVQRSSKILLGVRGPRPRSIIGGNLLSFPFKPTEENFKEFIEPWLNIDLTQKRGNPADIAENKDALAKCTTRAQKFWHLITHEKCGIDELSLAVLRSCLVAYLQPRCMDILDSISKQVNLSEYLSATQPRGQQ